MPKIIFISFLFILAIGLALIITQQVKVYQAVQKTYLNHPPFIRNNPQAQLRFLFIGDSTAKGTGAESNTQSVAGWFGQEFPQAHIENEGVDGRKIKQLAEDFSIAGRRPYDLVVIQIGGNDILRFTPLKQMDTHLKDIIRKAKQIARHVVILHSGNVGLAPIFIWPFDEIMTARASAMRKLYMTKAQEEGILYVDLFTRRSDDPFLKDIDLYYAADHLHPSGYGYHWWYQRIRQTLNQAGINLFGK